MTSEPEVASEAKRAGPIASERDLYARIYANSQDSVFLIEPSTGTILFSNPKAAEDTTYEQSELEAMSFKSLFLPEEQGAIETLVQSTLQWNSGTDPHRVLKRKSGKKIIVEITSLLVDFDGKKTVAASVRDITARVKAEQKVREYSQELEKINAELEDRVKARTAELASANDRLQKTNRLILLQKKQLDDVMNNIQQAIFTISPKLKINTEYSKFAEEVYGAKPIAGAEISEFLFSKEELPARGQELRDWLASIFEQPETWDLIKDFGIREHRFERLSADGQSETRDLSFGWRPIFEDSNSTKIAKVMLVCNDITEQKRLQAQMERQEAEHKEELELISQLVHLPAEIVEQFVADFKRNLAEGKRILVQGSSGLTPESLAGLKRALHTIKGSARQFNLASVQNRAHALEDFLDASEEKSDLPLSDLRRIDLYEKVNGEFLRLETSLENIISLYRGLYDKIAGQGGGAPRAKAATLTFPVSLEKLDALLQKPFAGNRMLPAHAVRKAIAWLLQAPVKSLFDRLEDLAHSLAKDLERETRVLRAGDAVMVDSRVLSLLYDGFLHCVRNSLDHGGESGEERQARGKSPALTLAMKAQAQGEDIIIELADDGRGIDLESLRKKAIDKKLATPKELARMSVRETLRLVLLPGFSTRDEVSELSGRGVGLDALREIAEKKLGGEIEVISAAGKGTRIRVKFPKDAFSRTALNPCSIASSAEERALWEKELGMGLDELKKGQKPQKNQPVLLDLSRIEEALRLGCPRDGLVCVGEVEPSRVMEELVSSGSVDHFLHLKMRNLPFYAASTLKRLVSDEGRADFGLKQYLPHASVSEFKIRDYSMKNKVIDELLTFAENLRGFAGLPEIVGTIADEMLMNAIFAAPRDPAGKPKYNHLSRQSDLVLEEHEEATFRFAASKEWVALSIEDPFGALTRQVLADYVSKGYRKGRDQIDQKKGGAGLGLFMIYDNSNALVVNVLPGQKTELISLVALGNSYEEYQRSGKSLSLFIT